MLTGTTTGGPHVCEAILLADICFFNNLSLVPPLLQCSCIQGTCPQPGISMALSLWAHGCISAVAQSGAGAWWTTPPPLLSWTPRPVPGALRANHLRGTLPRRSGSAGAYLSKHELPPAQRCAVCRRSGIYMRQSCSSAQIRFVLLRQVVIAACSRCRHAVAAVGPYMFTYGGLRGSALLDDFLLADDSTGSADLSVCDPRSQAWYGPSSQEFSQTFHGHQCSPAHVYMCSIETHAPNQPPKQLVVTYSAVAEINVVAGGR